MKNYFVIIGKGDVPVYEAQLSHPPPSSSSSNTASGGNSSAPKAQREDLLQFIVHASLDSIDMKLSTSTALYFRAVDRFGDYLLSSLVSTSGMRFILIHEPRLDDAFIRPFMFETFELNIKLQLNPFHDKHAPINSKTFDDRVRALADKYINR